MYGSGVEYAFEGSKYGFESCLHFVILDLQLLLGGVLIYDRVIHRLSSCHQLLDVLHRSTVSCDVLVAVLHLTGVWVLDLRCMESTPPGTFGSRLSL
jgi:hypothetical protein